MRIRYRYARSLLAGFLAVVLLFSLVPAASAAQQNSYHDPAENWKEPLDRTNELDANAVVTHETFDCAYCNQARDFIVYRTPEYTRTGETALNRGVKFSDGTMLDGKQHGSLDDGTPGVDAYFTGYHWTKAVCQSCGTINANMGTYSYSYDKNVYWLFDCAANFFEDLPESVEIEQVDREYHRVITTGGQYCGFCYGTYHTEDATLERHHMETSIRPELAHQRFVEMDTCADCGYAKTSYTAAKAVVADYYGVADGAPHTVTVSDLSEAGVTTAVRYGHSAATCTTPQLCTKCGAVIKNTLGHDYQEDVTAPTCTAMGFTTFTCSRCGDTYDGAYTNPTGHTPSEWIVDKEPDQDSAGSRHKECTVCGEVLETEELEKLYASSTTDEHGEAVVGRYLVIVTDTDSKAPVSGAAVELGGEEHLSIRLPDRRLLDYADQTTITVLLAEPEPPVEGLAVSVTDKNANYCGGKTDKAGQLTVPGSSGTTNEDGNATVGYEDADGSRWTLTVQVERTETGRPIADAAVSVGRTGNITASLPKGQDMDSRHRVTVTVTDQETTPQKNVTVIVKSDLGGTAQGQTNKDGELTVPAADSAYTDDTGTAVVGQYTVIVTDTAEKPVKGALVTLLAGEDGERDAFTVLLPDGRLLDGNDQTVVTVLLPTAKPATGLNVEVSDEQRNHAARDTDKKGQITVPDASGSAGEIIGTDTGDEDKSNTVNVDVADQDGKPVEDAEITVDKDGAVSVTLPDDFTFDEDGPVTVTVTDNKGEAKPGVSVTVEDGDGTTAAGETGKDGKVTLPAAYHFAYLVGYGDGTIGPDRNMTRGEAAAVFARVLSEARGDELEGLRRSRFPDVRRDAWYADYVAYLEKLGVVVGYPDGLFHAEATITREQFVAMSVRLDEWMELETYDSKRGSFPDVPGSHWAADYIQEATRNGWIVGYADGLFHGGDQITRAEVAAIVNRMLGRTADERFIRHNEDELTTFRDLQNPHYWAYYDLMEAANGHTIVTGAEDETWHEVR